jgi:hypothetical protein
MLQGVQSGPRRLAASVCAAAATLCLLAALALAPHAEASASGTLTMSPPTSSIRAGETVAVTIDLGNAVNVHEVDVYITYDAAVLSVVDADPATAGTQMLPGPFFSAAGPGTVTQNSAGGGVLRYGYRLNASAEASGSGTLATVEFQGIAAGDAKLRFGTVTLKDAQFAQSSPDTSGGSITVGGSDSAAAVTDTPTDTPTAVASASDTATPSASATTAGTSTPTATANSTGTATPTRTRTATASTTVTPKATATPRITVLENSNDPTRTIEQKLGVDGAAAKQQQGLPNAGNGGPGIQWWRWTFFGAALMLGVAGWFFTFALHQSDRDVVLLDRYDRRRRRKW